MSENNSYVSGAEEETEYEVERILAESTVEGKVVYLVKWQNYDDNQCTWEPAESFLTPATLADWQQQLANNDTLDEDEVAGVQARMDAFLKAQEEDPVDQDHLQTQSTTQRHRESPPTTSQPTTKRPRDSPPAAKQLGSYVATNLKIGTAQRVRSDQVTSVFSDTPKPRADNTSIPASSNAKPGSPTIPSAPKPIPKPANLVLPSKQRSPAVAASKPPMVSIPTGSRKLSSSDGAPSASHTKNLTGKRFRNLSHQNNYAKKARREPAPDVSKLDLRSPNEWSSGGIRPTHKATGTEPRLEGRGSPLFVPEHENGFGTHPEKSPVERDIQGSADNDIAERRCSSTAEASHNPAVQHTESINLAPPSSIHETGVGGKDIPATKSGNLGMSQSSAKSVSESLPHLDRAESRSAVVPRAPDSPTVEKAVQQGLGPAGTTERSSSIARIGFESQTTSNATRNAFAEKRPPLVRREFHNTLDSERDGLILPPKFHEVVNPHQSFKDKQVILRFGAHDVGEVMLLGLPQWFSGKLNGLREDFAPLVNICFQEQYVMNVKDFATFAQHLDRRQHGHFAVEAYGNTLTAIESLCEYLESNDVGAIWEYPQPGDSLILVMYSCHAPGWQHLGKSKNRDSRLHVALLNKVVGYFLANAPVRSDRPVAFERNIDLPRPNPDIGQSQSQRSAPDDTTYVQSPTDLQTPMTLKPTTRDPAFLVQTQKSSGRRESTSFSDSMDWTPSTPAVEANIFFSTSFDAMVAGLDKQARPRVFITFAKARPAEAKAVTEWLWKHLSARYVFSDEQKNDWEDFRGELSSQPSIILFHERYPCYCEIPYLYKYLRAASLWCFNVSFRPLDDSLCRLFPRGNVLCITEDTLLHNPEGALAAMKTFEEGSIGKAQSWKLVLPPDFVSWVARQVNEGDYESQKRHIGMLEIWYNLRKRSSEASPRYYDDPERFIRDLGSVEDDQLVMSPKNLPDYVDWDTTDMGHDAVRVRDTAFIKYFTGWSMTNISKYRLFTVVDSKHTNKTEKQSCHIWFRDPASYGRQGKK